MENSWNKLVNWFLKKVSSFDPDRTARLAAINIGRRAATDQLKKYDPVLTHEIIWAFNELERLYK
jgi:hypothetical protein